MGVEGRMRGRRGGKVLERGQKRLGRVALKNNDVCGTAGVSEQSLTWRWHGKGGGGAALKTSTAAIWSDGGYQKKLQSKERWRRMGNSFGVVGEEGGGCVLGGGRDLNAQAMVRQRPSLLTPSQESS
jgi:hypothetical protein